MLDKKSLDIITEVISIGIGDAASALSNLVNSRVIISVPDVRLMPVTEIHDFVRKDVESLGVYISQDFSGAISGKSILFYTQNCSLSLLSSLFKRKPVAAAHTAAGISTLQEIGNILLGACITSISDMMASPTKFDLPEVTVEVSDQYFKNMLTEMEDLDQALVVKNEMVIQDRNISGYLFILLSIKDFQKVIDIVRTRFKG
jgi:chemotaxis protein CheC